MRMKAEQKEKALQMPASYAIFTTGGKQYQAVEGKTLSIEKIAGNPGDAIEFNEVLFYKKGENSFEFGHPFLTKTLKATIVKQMRDPKVIAFRFKRRKKVRVKKGHRQHKTVVRFVAV